MAKTRNLDDAMDKYGVDNGEFFKLENDKDTEVVRFLHEGPLVAERDWFVAHEVEIEGKKRWVQCPEEDDCPVCGIGNKQQIKLFLQLVTKTGGVRKTWERGKTFIPTIRKLYADYGDLCNRPYEIERNGAARDRNTFYELFPLDRDDKTLDDIPVEPQELLGKYGEGLVLKLTYDELEDVAKGRYRPTNSRDAGRESGRDSGRGDRGSERGRDSGRGSERDRGARGLDRGRDDRDRGGRDSERSERGSERDRGDRGRERDEDRGSERGRERDDRDAADAPPSRRSERKTGSEIF